MRCKIPISASIIILIVLMAIPLATPQARANNGSPATDPSNLWYPYGPSTGNVLLHFYGGQSQALQAFELGQLDMVDAGFLGVPIPKWASYTANPNFVLSPVQGNDGYFMINMNLMSNRFKAWGCDWANGNSQCGVDMREAFAHLVDRQQWVIDGPLNGAGQALADPTWPATTPSGSPLSEQCSWDSLPQYHDNCTFAFHFSSSPCAGGFCSDPSQPDFCAAVSYMIQADIDSGNHIHLARDNSAPMDQFGFHCGLDISSTNIDANHILAFIRNNDPNRLALGNGFKESLNSLFGTNVVDATYGSIAQARPIVFRDGFTKGAALWDWYTGGTGAAGPYPEHLYRFYNGLFASDACGGRPLLAPSNNYLLACVPSLDADTAAAQHSADISTFIAATLRAFHDYGSHVVDLPAFTGGLRTVALKSAAGLVNQLGFGYNNFFSLLSAHSDGTTTGTFAFGGGDPTILRYGMSGGTSELNIFNAYSFDNEGQVIFEVYDSLFASNPVEPGQFFCWMCNNYDQFVDPSGNIHFTVELRQGLRWQDGTPLTAYDVKFSLMNERDFSSYIGSGVGGLLLDQTSVLSNTVIDIVMSGFGFPPFTLIPSLSFTLIIPRHIWELAGDHTYGEVGRVDPAKLDPSYDPLASGTLIGSGPFACVSLGGLQPFPEGLCWGWMCTPR